ncbi:MAG: VCBS repeat-containing protein [Planctomycetes bacterium]|nr:VCBS repeat-containing protein [Planctomycetota bacterium]
MSSPNTSGENPSPGVAQSRRFLMVAIPIALVAVGVIVARVDWTSSQRLYDQARAALERGDFPESLRLGNRLMSRPSHRVEGILFVAESQARQGQFDAALASLDPVSTDKPRLKAMACLLAARILCDDLHRPNDAETLLHEALRYDPNSLPAHEKLSFILGLSGRSWEAVPHRLILISQDRFSLHILSLLALGSTAAENPEILKQFANVSPNDPNVLCGLARVALREGDVDEGEKLLDRILQIRPDLFAAQGWKGEVLVNRRDHAALTAWNAALPAGADEFPDIWFVRGNWAVQRDEPRVAVRCFWECLRRDGNNYTASYLLANLLSQLGEPDSAEAFRKHTRLLGELITSVKTVEMSGSLQAAPRAAEACDALGLKMEAWAWRHVQAGSRSSEFQWDPQKTGNSRPKSGFPRLDPKLDPTIMHDLQAYPLPSGQSEFVRTNQPGRAMNAASGRIAFVEEAAGLGIDFSYQNGSHPETDSEFMFEFAGGGVGVLDFDLDGWPDLYLTQGSENPPQVPQETLLDRLFRNTGAGQFIDVTLPCGIRDTGFSHGCSVGDFDNDGFPDLYVANIGANRFYHNNGDGTFSDLTAQTGTAGDRWTISCAIADFNGDGNPDIFTANYVTGKDLFTKPCRMADGSTRLCTPHDFQAEHDQLFVSLGDGRFEDQSAPSGIEVPEGKGLGVVAAVFDRTGLPSLFVANDAVPNFYFHNATQPRGTEIRFDEQGYLSGLAVDADGQAQACMGVAAGDANGDGRLDLFVTNFRNESNTLYVQQPDGSFLDATRQSGLREPSFAMLGFGTQFLDADLDGWEDLVLTNGHVGNLTRHGLAYEMPPQFFHNVGQGRFVELSPTTLGTFFAGKYLGRGLSRIDWNRDGREDFVISHLKSPAAIVTNHTSEPGSFVAVRLCGVESARDAVGSQVTVTTAGRSMVRQLVSGDGYQASNQRQLVFGLGKSTAIEKLEVRWQTGQIQSFSEIPVNSEVLLREGNAAAMVLRKP